MNLYTEEKKQKRRISPSAVARIVIWSVVLVILAGVFAAGMFNVGGYTYSDPDSYEIGGGTVAETVRDIEIHWVAGDIEILPAEEGVTEITVKEDYDGADPDYRLRYRVFDGELTIQYCQSAWRINANNVPAKKLTVLVPQAMLDTLGEVEIDTVDSAITFRGRADELAIEGVEGKVTASGYIGKLNIDGMDAQVDFTGTLGEGDFDGVDITAVLRLDSVRELDIDGVSQDVTVYFAEGVTGFAVARDGLSTSVTTSGFDGVTKRNGYDFHWGDGSARIDLDGIDVKLKIEKQTNG